MSRENVEIVQAAWEAWERGDMEAIFALYDPAIVWDQTHYRAGELSDVYHGHDGIKQFFRAWLAPFDSYYAHAEEFVDAGEAVLVRLRQGGRGKQSGAEVQMPPYWQVYRLRDGLAVRIEVYSDRVEAHKAVGLAEQAMSEKYVDRWQASCGVTVSWGVAIVTDDPQAAIAQADAAS